MITDSDIKKLKSVFATKNDLLAMEKRQDKKYATKDDLKKFATKDDLKTTAKEIVKDVAQMLQSSIIPMLDEHEKRLDRLEKRVGGFPPMA